MPREQELPNENFARELMQLFSIGLYRLNLDGSLTLDAAGFPIETYGQEAILGTAAVLYRLDVLPGHHALCFQPAGQLAQPHGQRAQPSFHRCEDHFG